ncbi:hypothetical protein NW752_010383 [Fusarium irregulare]|uniref:Apple domain-containing protein n=1 Tax=Fusarium irregulare TaxID=2494466 RepID=A0A9W8PJI1_9HYPO|nr:hypothetical protein NW752_010383 [Fusarium irregulare]KAJ4008020.1 hypothetical protein NW766_009835 [Fusarium irregulare]
MRPQILIAALALVEFGAAGPCKPSSRSTANSALLTSSVPTADVIVTSTNEQNGQTSILSRSATLSIETVTEVSGSQTTIVDGNTVTNLMETSTKVQNDQTTAEARPVTVSTEIATESTAKSVFLTSSVPTTDLAESFTNIENGESTVDLAATVYTETATEASSSQMIIDSNTVTTALPSTDVPSLTLAQSTTATEEEITIITNAIEGGSFASRDPNNSSGLTNFNAEGNAEFHSGGCYRGDNSQDDGCAALSATGDPGSKRSLFGRMARIYQTVRSVPRRKNTIQFFYHLTSGGDCTVAARFGGSEFWSAAASRNAGSWVKVLGQVEAMDGLPTFDVSLTCSGAGSSSILIDSIFISDKVTPETIGNVQLDFGSAPVPDVTTPVDSTSRPVRTSGSLSSNSAKVMPTTSSNQQTSTGSKEITMEESLPVIGTTAIETLATTSPHLVESSSSADITAERSPPTTDIATQESYNPTSVDSQEINISTFDRSTGIAMEGPPSVTSTPSLESHTSASVDPEEPKTSTEVREITAERLRSVTNIILETSGTSSINLEKTGSTSDSSAKTTMEGSPSVIDTTAIESDATTSAVPEETNSPSFLTTTDPREDKISTSTLTDRVNDTPTSKTTTAEPAELTGCSATCALIEDYQQHYDDFGCNLNGVFTKTDAIYGFGSDDNPNMQFYARDVEQCSEFCKIQFPGCKSVGFQKLSSRCFFSNTLVTREEVRDGRDSQVVDWYNINKCFECRTDCGEGTSPVEIISTPVQKPTTTAQVLSTTTEQVPSKTEPTEPTKSPESTCSPTCQRIEDFTWHTEDWSCGLYGAASGDIYTLPADIPGDTLRYENVNECGAICKTLPGCKSAGYQPASMRCFYSNSVVTEVTQASDSQSADWNSLKCFKCAGCGFDDPDPHGTTTQASTSEIPSTTHESSSFVTTTRPSQLTGVCYNNRGQQCEISHSGVENNPYVCITAGVLLGESWTEPRSRYPVQENPEGCAAICDTLPNCETSAFFGSENHCLFTSTKVTEADFAEPDPNYEEPGFDPKNAVWSHRSCYTCPACIPSNDPLPKSPTCNYKAGDYCTRKENINAVCNFSGVLNNNYYQYSSSLYPEVNQDTAAKCAAICRTRKDCVGSASIRGSCYFTYQVMTPGSFRQMQGITHVWDDPSCWDCPGCHT